MGLFNFFKKPGKSKGLTCPACGEIHDHLPAIGFATPFFYETLSEQDKMEIAECSDDFCVIRYETQTDRFVRATLTLDVNDACENLDYGIWVSLSEQSFNEYRSEFNSNIEGKTYFGRISSLIPDYDESTLGLHVNVVTRSGGMRPELHPHQNGHKLISDWEKGITIAEAISRVEQCERNSGS